MTFDGALAQLARLSDERLMTGRWTFAGKPNDARYALHHALEAEQRAVIEAPRAESEAARILSLAQATFGDMRGLLAGIDGALLDRSPAEGEWSLRETLAHAIGVERSYRANTTHAITRTETEPLSLPPERRPAPDQADTAGGVLEILARFALQRAETDATFAHLTAGDLTRPSLWVRYDVDVRFRLHRFASHIAEHAIQCAKTVTLLGSAGGDARTICQRIGYLRGLHERRTDAGALRALDAALDAKADALEA